MTLTGAAKRLLINISTLAQTHTSLLPILKILDAKAGCSNMHNTSENVFAENTSTLNYWRYLEYAKQVLRTKASQNPRTKAWVVFGCLIFLAMAVWGIGFLYNPENFLFIAKRKGSLYALAGVIVMPVGFVFMVFCLFQTFFPYMYLGSRFRSKLSQDVFTNAAGVRLKEVTIHTCFFSDRIVVNREGIITEIGWERTIEVTESKHFYFLILRGEVIDKHNAFIRSGIIVQKDGFTKGSWESLRCYLAQFGSEEVQRNLLEQKSTRGK